MLISFRIRILYILYQNDDQDSGLSQTPLGSGFKKYFQKIFHKSSVKSVKIKDSNKTFRICLKSFVLLLQLSVHLRNQLYFCFFNLYAIGLVLPLFGSETAELGTRQRQHDYVI